MAGDDCSSFDIKCIIKEGVKLVICVKKWTDLWIFCHYYHYYDDLLFIVLFRFLYCNLFPKSRQPSFCYFCWDVTCWQERCHKMNLNGMYSSHKSEFFNVWISLTTDFISASLEVVISSTCKWLELIPIVILSLKLLCLSIGSDINTLFLFSCVLV